MRKTIAILALLAGMVTTTSAAQAQTQQWIMVGGQWVLVTVGGAVVQHYAEPGLRRFDQFATGQYRAYTAPRTYYYA